MQNSQRGHSIWYTHVRAQAAQPRRARARDRVNRPTARARRVNGALQHDYTTVGHVTVDVLPDGSRRIGGSAFYSALQAARLGLRTLIITRGAAGEIEELIAPYRGELELEILAAECTTTLETAGEGHARSQRVRAWAGPLPEDLVLDTAILHLAPVARETPQRWRGRAGFVGLTPQGLVRRFSQSDPVFSLAALHGEAARSLAARCDALVLASVERESCAELISAARLGGAVVAVTAGAGASTLLLPDGSELEVGVAALSGPRDDLGAGDVFAAALFVRLSEGAPVAGAAAFAAAAAAVRLHGVGPAAIGDRRAIEAALAADGDRAR